MTANAEENTGAIYFDVVRRLGSLGTVSVELVTVAATANTQNGADIVLSEADKV